MVFSLPDTKEFAPLPGPGAIITVGQARTYITAYKNRIGKLNDAFNRLPIGHVRPFNPNDESLGWVFSREIIEECLKQIPTDARHVALVFGVGPREVDDKGQGIAGSPFVAHAMMTAAKAVGENRYELPAYHPSRKNSDNFGAEQGGTCCNGRLIECTQSLIDTGQVETSPTVIVALTLIEDDKI